MSSNHKALYIAVYLYMISLRRSFLAWFGMMNHKGYEGIYKNPCVCLNDHNGHAA